MSPAAAPLDALLRGRFASEPFALSWRALVPLAVLCGFAYGLVMGSYGLRPLQSLFSALKLPLLVGMSATLVMPNFLVVNAFLGLRDDLPDVLRAVLAAQVTVGVTLLAMAPVTAFQYVAGGGYDFAIVWNGGVFLCAALCGQITLQRHYRVLVARNPRHRTAQVAWLLLYVFVSIQMAWVLRPFVGNPDKPTQFFRSGAWGNAYVEVAAIVWRWLLS